MALHAQRRGRDRPRRREGTRCGEEEKGGARAWSRGEDQQRAGESPDRTARAATSMVQMYARHYSGRATRARPWRLGEEEQRSQWGRRRWA